MIAEQVQAMTETCTRCGAEPGVDCTNPVTGQRSTLPCVARLLGRPVASAPDPDRRRRRR